MTRLSVVVCSIDETKRARIRRHYESLLSGHAFELIQISDARSLAEAYNRGVAQSSGEIVVFSHDDIEFLSEGFAARLLAHFESCDLLGVAGATRLGGPSWVHAYSPHIHGCVANDRRGWAIDWFGPPADSGVHALDGVFFAATRELCREIAFDAAAFDGFHLYDVDFSYRAFLAGFRTRVCCDLLLLHQSPGSFDDTWRRYARRFIAKHREAIPPPPWQKAPDWRYHRFESREALVEFHARMQAALTSTPRGPAPGTPASRTP